jgi:hypothetical protein
MLTTFIQSVENRPVWDQMKVELEASDIGTSYTRLVQKETGHWREHFLSVLCEMRDARTEYVVRFEDDCTSVNRHIKHNLLTWPALKEPAFGVGWGYRPGNITGSHERWWFGGVPGSLCTIFRTEDMPQVLDFCTNCNLPQDLAMSQAVAAIRREVCIHGPSLVQHSMGVKSAFGHTHGPDGTSHCFDGDWKR